MSAVSLNRRQDDSVEALLRRISVLVAVRQELRTEAGRGADLEQNRLEIIRCQLELCHALIELYARKAA